MEYDDSFYCISNGSLNTRVALWTEDGENGCFDDPKGPLSDAKWFYESRACRLKENASVIGDDALHAWKEDLDGSGVSWALREGEIDDEDTMVALWRTGINTVSRKHSYIMEEKDGMDLILIEKPLTSKFQRERITELAFAMLPRQGRFYLGMDAMLSHYTRGRSMGFQIETGYERTYSVPIYEGYALPHAIEVDSHNESAMTGKSAMKYLSKVIFEQTRDQSFSKNKWECQIPFLESLLTTHVCVFEKNEEEYLSWLKSLELMPIKEASDVARFSDLLYGRAVSDYGRHLPSDLTHLLSQMYDFDPPFSTICLPDSKKSFVLGKEKRAVFEKESCPFEDGSEDYYLWRTMPELTSLNGIHLCDIDIRRDLFVSVGVAGGLSNIPGFTERIENMAKDRHDSNSIRVRVGYGRMLCPFGGGYTAMTGAQLLGSLSTFDDMYITRQDYNESGPSIVHRKCQ